MEIPFDIKYRFEIESGKYKLKCGEKDARIICWNARGSLENHIIALVGNSGEAENIQRFYQNGHLIADSSTHRRKDLKIVIEEIELTKYEEEFYHIIAKFISLSKNPLDITNENTIIDIKNFASELLDSVREEILKDVPKFKRMDEDKEYVGIRFFGEHTTNPVLCLRGLEIPLSDLEKLPKEE